jgi:hypothetical protein
VTLPLPPLLCTRPTVLILQPGLPRAALAASHLLLPTILAGRPTFWSLCSWTWPSAFCCSLGYTAIIELESWLMPSSPWLM